ncbi:hypothetical protein LC612_42345 [Nostoc sp. CHAB 5834]|nr:hypothetical protein [Nostoc sp. CHAB 5834]
MKPYILDVSMYGGHDSGYIVRVKLWGVGFVKEVRAFYWKRYLHPIA